MSKYKNEITGIVLEPRSELVEAQLAKDPNYTKLGAKEAAAKPAEPKPLEKMKKEELLEVAAGLKLTVPEGTSNKNIVALIQAAQSGDGNA